MPQEFSEHVGLLDAVIDGRAEIVARLEQQLLNVQGKDTARRRDRPFFQQTFDACVFAAPGIPPEASRHRHRLALKHAADGFEPLRLEAFANDLDPIELVVRAYGYWDAHRWPGRSGRLTYAASLFTVYVLRQLEFLTLRIWDDGHEEAGARLLDIQRLLDRLNQPPTSVWVRDARWLVHTAQGPVTRHLAPYFRVADRIAGSLGAADRIEIHRAGARLTGGHLRSQRRYRASQSQRDEGDPEILAATRNSNAMDGSLLIRDLLALLDAYRDARSAADVDRRRDLADSILQGLSADPDLFVTRLDLVAPYLMIEDLFLSPDTAPGVVYSPAGERQAAHIDRYRARIAELAEPLLADAAAFDPEARAYSPYAIVYGFCADILANMAMTSLVDPRPASLSFEDTFGSHGPLDDLRTRASTWEQLPTRPGELNHFAHSAEYASRTYGWLVDALRLRVEAGDRPNASGRGDRKLLVRPLGAPGERARPDGPSEPTRDGQAHCLTSDVQLVETTGSNLYPKSRILADRAEGRFLASVERDGKWFAVSKVLLTLDVGEGHHVVMTVPDEVSRVLEVTCSDLLVQLPSGSEGPA